MRAVLVLLALAFSPIGHAQSPVITVDEYLQKCKSALEIGNPKLNSEEIKTICAHPTLDLREATSADEARLMEKLMDDYLKQHRDLLKEGADYHMTDPR